MVYTMVLLLNVFCLGVTIYCMAKAGLVPGAPSVSGIAGSSAGSFKFNKTAAASAAAAAYSNASSTAAGYNNQTAALSFNSTSSAYTSVMDVEHNAKLQLYYLGCVMAVMTCVVFVVTLVMLPRLRVAIATIKVACDTMRVIPQLVLFPLWGAAWMVLFMIWRVHVLIALIYLSCNALSAPTGPKS